MCDDLCACPVSPMRYQDNTLPLNSGFQRIARAQPQALPDLLRKYDLALG